MVIDKELLFKVLTHGERSSAGQNDQEEEPLKCFFIQRPPLEEQSTRDRESATPYPSQGPTQYKMVIAKELSM